MGDEVSWQSYIFTPEESRFIPVTVSNLSSRPVVLFHPRKGVACLSSCENARIQKMAVYRRAHYIDRRNLSFVQEYQYCEDCLFGVDGYFD